MLDVCLLCGNVVFVVCLLCCILNFEILVLDEIIGFFWDSKILKKMNKMCLFDLICCVEVIDKDLEIMGENCFNLELFFFDKCFKIRGYNLLIFLCGCKMLKMFFLVFIRVFDDFLI